jgi:hypothetical protein
MTEEALAGGKKNHFEEVGAPRLHLGTMPAFLQLKNLPRKQLAMATIHL